ncbi:MAG: hypothetical protein AB7U35_08545 [Sphingobium sp.]
MAKQEEDAQSDASGQPALRPGGNREGSDSLSRAQPREAGKNLWSERRKQDFLDVLKATCNVQEACRVVGMGAAGAYGLKKRDPAFAAAWQEAVEHGYAELELALLRQTIFGSETTETVDDSGSDGRRRVKTVRSYPHAVALRLLLSHKAEAEAYRLQQGLDRPDVDALRAEIEQRIAALRSRAVGRTGQSERDDGEG